MTGGKGRQRMPLKYTGPEHRLGTNIPAITVAQMAEVDRIMIETYRILLIQMMENAGRNLAELTRRRLGGQVVGKKINSGCPVLSLDAPSGLDITSGVPRDPCVRASATLTLALPKSGLTSPDTKPFVGDLFLADISVPPELYHRIGLALPPIFVSDIILQIS